jgi:hypothetical protein
MPSRTQAGKIARMLVNLDNALSIVVSGSKVLVDFRDTSVHMRKFRNRRELTEILKGWDVQTRELRKGPLSAGSAK